MSATTDSASGWNSKGKGKRKKVKTEKPLQAVPVHESPNGAETNSLSTKPQASNSGKHSNSSATGPSTLLSELDDVPEPSPRDETEAAAQKIAEMRSRLDEEGKVRLDSKLSSWLFRQIPVTIGEKKTSLRRLARRAQKNRAFKEMSGDEPGLRKKLRDETMAEIPSWSLRRDAPKMQLRPWEHEALPLDRFGEGHLFSPSKIFGHKFGGLHDAAWGIFGKIEAARHALAAKWAGKDPEAVLRQQEFYDDILDNAAPMELTMMLVSRRPIPLEQLRNRFLERQSLVLRQVPLQEDLLEPQLQPEFKQLLAGIKRRYTENTLSRSGLLDKRGNVRPDSKLILTVGPSWQLTAEAITPGKLSEQKTVMLGFWKDKRFTKGVLENFLGLYPVDPIGKTSVGNGILYVTNGFNFQIPELSGNEFQQYKEDDDEKYIPNRPTPALLVSAGPGLFSFSEPQQRPRPPLLNGIRRQKH